MKLLIALSHPFELWNPPDWVAQKLRTEFPGLEVVHLKEYSRVNEEILEAEIVIAWSLRPGQITSAKKLRWVHCPAAAVHALIFPEMVESDVVLTNASSVHGPVVAEHVIALIFALAKRIPQAVRLQERHEWGQQTMWESSPRPREIRDTVLGLVGLGSIGSPVAKYASALGMRVIAVREHPELDRPGGVDHVFSPDQLESFLSQSDFVVLAVPITPRTRQLIDAARLKQMKRGAYLINVGRGALIDHAALAEALRHRQIGGAALDVFEKEPLAPESPLWNLENLLITPHSAGLTEKLWHRHYDLIARNLSRYFSGQPLLGVVDKVKGY